MKRLDTCLSLILPRALETQVVDSLLQHPQWVGPFITSHVEGHGDVENIGSPAEQVRGRAARLKIEILTEAGHAEALIAHLAEDLRGANVFWWVSPVGAAGGFA